MLSEIRPKWMYKHLRRGLVSDQSSRHAGLEMIYTEPGLAGGDPPDPQLPGEEVT